MSIWTEEDSFNYREIAAIAVPRRAELVTALVSRIPFDATRPLRVVDVGCGDGGFAERILDEYPQATLLGLDGSLSMREAASRRLRRFGERTTVRPFDLAALEWWDRMRGADVVLASLVLHHLGDAKKQYLYKAAAERISTGGVLLVADLIAPVSSLAQLAAADEWDQCAKAQADSAGRPDLYDRFVALKWNHYRFPDASDQPAALLHNLVWLKHSGFQAVDCFWLFAGHAALGGFK